MNRTGRRWGRLSVQQLAVLASSTPAFAGSPRAEGFTKLSAAQIRQAFVGKTFSDDTHFSDRYKTDGTIVGTSMGKKINNRWKIVKDTLCITDKRDELCYAVWVKGREVKLVYENSDLILEGTIK